MKTLVSISFLLALLSLPATSQVLPANDEMAVHFIDVGQADATLLEFPCGAILIDAGVGNDDRTQQLIAYLDSFFQRRGDLNNTLNLVLITHCHVDHNRALDKVANRYTIENYIDNGKKKGSGKKNQVWMKNNFPSIYNTYSFEDITKNGNVDGLTNNKIDPINCNDIDPIITLLSGTFENKPSGWSNDDFVKNGNNHSLVVKVEYGESSFLFTGDLDFEGIETMLRHYGAFTNPAVGNILDIDVYQVGHHGAKNGTNKELINSMTPKHAVISMGQWTNVEKWTASQYGHPHTLAIEALTNGISEDRDRVTREWVGLKGESRGAPNVPFDRFEEQVINKSIYATGWDGTIVIIANTQGEYVIDY
ncbi:ComEC/Rec2 family competence protein [Ekhidna sp.]|uniref:ComEC/Rec2 family competence protein n=1 Tax=Ekhidna sp. TaxID=2608089 RepID=UPI003B502169